jgi:hypothetical protein
MRSHLFGLTILVSVVIAGDARAQWTQTTQKESMNNRSLQRFKIMGSFLIPPRSPTEPPTFVVDCEPGEHDPTNAAVGGSFDEARITFGGAIMNQIPDGVTVSFRRDDQRIKVEQWPASPEGTMVLVPADSVAEILYGHGSVFRRSKAAQVRRLRIAANEYLASRVVAEFDLPESSSLAEACGLVSHKK